MISGRDIIFVSSIEWDYLWQVHQEIAFRFAEAGNRILYIENTGIRRPGLADAKRIERRVLRWSKSLLSREVREVSSNIFVMSPIVMPPFGSRVSRFINRRILLPFVKRAASKLKFRDPIMWTYLPSDTALDLIRIVGTHASVITYYCGADFRLLASRPRACAKTEEELLKSADLIFATCSQLEERCRRLNSNVHRIPALVDLNAFSLANSNGKHSPGSSSASGSGVVCPIIGYTGGIHRHIDYHLLIEMAQARPDWLWVFVGAASIDISGLLALRNVKFLGQRPHSELAQHLRTFDVCIVPYLRTDFTATVVPMKVNEYLAMGKPIVSTLLPAVCDFNEQHKILSTAPNETEPFLRAIETALCMPADAATVRRRREVAALGDSKAVVETIADLIENRLQKKRRARL